MAHVNRYAFDAATLLQDSKAFAAAASTAGTVAAVAKVVDLGDGSSQMPAGTPVIAEGKMIVDVSALDIGSGDELYFVQIQGSTTNVFTAAQVLGELPLGAVAGQVGIATTIGRYEVQWRNELNGLIYRYLRFFIIVSGTTPTITLSAWIAPDVG